MTNPSTSSLIFLRHGQSLTNGANKLTGWLDVDLSEHGKETAWETGKLFQQQGIHLDIVFTSYLKRAIRTAWLLLDASDQMWVPVHSHWQLNERHCGNLQGLDKAVLAQQHGPEQMAQWQFSYHGTPPPLPLAEQPHLLDRRYQSLLPHQLPLTESLAQTWLRIKPCWEQEIVPQLTSGKQVLLVAHGNVLRALYKKIAGVSDEQISKIFFNNTHPLHLTLDGQHKLLKEDDLLI